MSSMKNDPDRAYYLLLASLREDWEKHHLGKKVADITDVLTLALMYKNKLSGRLSRGEITEEDLQNLRNIIDELGKRSFEARSFPKVIIDFIAGDIDEKAYFLLTGFYEGMVSAVQDENTKDRLVSSSEKLYSQDEQV